MCILYANNNVYKYEMPGSKIPEDGSHNCDSRIWEKNDRKPFILLVCFLTLMCITNVKCLFNEQNISTFFSFNFWRSIRYLFHYAFDYLLTKLLQDLFANWLKLKVFKFINNYKTLVINIVFHVNHYQLTFSKFLKIVIHHGFLIEPSQEVL